MKHHDLAHRIRLLRHRVEDVGTTVHASPGSVHRQHPQLERVLARSRYREQAVQDLTLSVLFYRGRVRATNDIWTAVVAVGWFFPVLLGPLFSRHVDTLEHEIIDLENGHARPQN